MKKVKDIAPFRRKIVDIKEILTSKVESSENSHPTCLSKD